MGDQVTHTESAAVRKIGIEGWEPCIFERVAGGMLITGGIPKEVKGKKKWPPAKQMERLILTREDVDAEELRYEAKTGNCHACYGSGQQTIGWNHETGVSTRECPKCKGTGRAS